MLQFYYAPVSVNARRVWVTLLEKQIPFQPILMRLNGDQFTPDFAAINPLHRVPVIVDDGFRVVESLAILDYLEAKYPSPALMPKTAEAIATVRMVEMSALNELQPATMQLSRPFVGLDIEPRKLENANQQIIRVLRFYETLLSQNVYIASDQLTLADIVAGTLVPSVAMFGISMDAFPKITAWLGQLSERPSFQQTLPHPEQIEAALPTIKEILERRS